MPAFSMAWLWCQGLVAQGPAGLFFAAAVLVASWAGPAAAQTECPPITSCATFCADDMTCTPVCACNDLDRPRSARRDPGRPARRTGVPDGDPYAAAVATSADDPGHP